MVQNKMIAIYRYVEQGRHTYSFYPSEYYEGEPESTIAGHIKRENLQDLSDQYTNIDELAKAAFLKVKYEADLSWVLSGFEGLTVDK